MDSGQSLQLVKCYLTDRERVSEIRKFVVEKKDARNFSAICEKIRGLYPQLKNDEFCVFYTDEDGDKIVVSSDDELLAYHVTNRDALMKFNIELTGKKHAFAAVSSNLTEELGSCKGNIHEGVICDVCESKIRGFRYKCMKCPDYDLCGRCEAAGNHPGHMMARVSGPLDQFPKVFRAVRGVDGSWLAQGHKWGRKGMGQCESRQTESRASNAESGQQRMPRPLNFRCSVPSRWAARNVGLQREKEYLVNVGKALASHFESLGSDLHVDVHAEGNETIHCYPFGACPKAEGEEQREAADIGIAAVAASQAAAAAQAAARAAASAIESQNWDISSAESEVRTNELDEPENWDVPNAEAIKEEPTAEAEELKISHSSATEETEGVEEETAAREGEIELPQQESSTKTPSPDSGDWTFVGEGKHEEENLTVPDSSAQTQAGFPESVSSDERINEGQNGLYPNLHSLEPVHPDPKIAAALENMFAMGFTNEGGWLSQLLEVKGGDIVKVMDVLQGPF